jgi:uncharacterized alkaline shock family protein YloU
MHIIDRIFLALYSFLIAILSLLFILVPFSRAFYDWIKSVLEVYYTNWLNIIIPFFFFIISVRFLISGLKNNKSKSSSMSQYSTYGEIKISLQAIEGMAKKSAESISGFRDIKAIAKQTKEGVIIYISALALTDIDIPETVLHIQQCIKEYIERYTGISVKEVKMTIDNIAINSKGRVE